MKKSGLSKSGNYYNISHKNRFRFTLLERPHHQAMMVFYRVNGNASEGYVWLSQDKIRRFRQLLDRDRPDELFLNGKNINLKVEKREDNNGIIVLKDDHSHFLDYFWLEPNDVINVLQVLNRILPNRPKRTQFGN